MDLIKASFFFKAKVKESDFKANSVASFFNLEDEYPGINSRKGVKAIITVVKKINKMAPEVATTKTFIRFNFKEKISSKVSSFKITNRFLVNHFLWSFFLLSLFSDIYNVYVYKYNN